MSSKKREDNLLAYDVFTKVEEDIRIRTRTGGLITLICIGVTFLLLISEWFQFKKVISKPELVIDRDYQSKLELNIDVTFPYIPCDLLNLDILDDSGNVQLDIDLEEASSNFVKTRLNNRGEVIGKAKKFKITDDLGEYAPEDKENYCGSCYGSKDQTKNEDIEKITDKVCCNSCEDVRQAYSEAGWAFFDGKNIEQCEREGYVKTINERLSEGCRVKGEALLNKIHGNLHFAPGKAFQNRRGHFHDTSLFNQHKNLNFQHVINHLSFGKPIRQLVTSNFQDTMSDSLRAQTAPIDGHQAFIQDNTGDSDSASTTIAAHDYQFIYYAEIISTRFEYLKGDLEETSQLTVTSHYKKIGYQNGQDYMQGMQSRSGIPGLYIDFEVSPLKVINKEQYSTSWSGYLLKTITSIGGILAVGTVIDKVVYATQTALKQASIVKARK
ncbi:hypothetical protein TPHA_0H02930 [Tetrapisispora phaffii CBS 4417]|uniref:Endoplasmic reticulum-Golgi intermediate compartment protein n=1 Tax=Tetrapisispora phaffii (strain ATCC 24235 / CBS 4417 / NBRC 1672 / NRRL Y-8282 / UCD 70-5) TaxID=1071381 RepID=G8BWP5_TETPH|nr:hypothetical protein TPHA_0H02930 [Tetrapisispora phaffii CBS 4417]CCE64496.1 hypothetical protein TPHA_0H02930 [Tetrapisispora phaffii CBS 4417]